MILTQQVMFWTFCALMCVIKLAHANLSTIYTILNIGHHQVKKIKKIIVSI